MIVNVEDLSFSYGNNQILKDINFSVKEPEILSIIGPNGTGKTTLLKCLNNLNKWKIGEIYIFGKNIKDISLKEKSNYIAYVPQQTNIEFSISGIEMILQGRIPHSGSKVNDEDLNIVYDLIEKLNIEKIAFRNIDEMSGGERQLIMIARALAQEPKIMILDEPTSALDMKNQVFILEIMEELKKEKDMTVLMTIHDINVASMFSDEILILFDKKVYDVGEPKQVITAKMLNDIYGVNAKIISDYKYPIIYMEK